MKTTILNICFGLLLSGALLASVPATAQSFYAEVPCSVFQSTSTMGGSGSAYSSNPTLDENGTANSPSASAPKSVKRGLGLPEMPSTEGDSGNTPVGDAVLPMLLIAMAYTACAVVRRRRKQLA